MTTINVKFPVSDKYSIEVDNEGLQDGDYRVRLHFDPVFGDSEIVDERILFHERD